MFRYLIAIALTALVAGCSIKAGKVHTFAMGNLQESPLPKAEVPQVILTTPEEAEPLFKEATVTCEDPTQCPEAVGYLLINIIDKDNKTGIMQCTGFLIERDVLVTNSHCVPESIRENGADCKDVIEVLFPGVDEKVKEMRARCSKVIRATNAPTIDFENFKARDYAVLKLDHKLKRTPFEVSRSGLPDGTKLFSFAVDPTSDTVPKGLLRRRECTSMQGIHFAPEYSDSFAPIASAVGCNVVQGNSGSPMVDENMNLKGILFGGANSADIEEKFEVVANDADEFENVNVIVNSACMDLPNTNPRAECNDTRVPIMTQKLNLISSDELDKAYKQWKKTSDQRFGFYADKRFVAETPLIPQVNHLQAQISCVKPISKWPQGEKFAVAVELPRWGFVAGLDRYTRPTVSIEEVARYRSRFTLSRKQIVENNLKRITVTSQDTKGFMAPQFRDVLNFSTCR